MSTTYILLGIFAAINLFSFIVVANDKRKSIRSGTDRTPEGILFFLASAFGAIGVYAGMFTFRHKTRKWYFQLGIPLLIIENIATVFVLKGILQIS